MSQQRADEAIAQNKIIIEIDQLSSKQRNAILGLIKDVGFTLEEIQEVTVTLPIVSEDKAEGRSL